MAKETAAYFANGDPKFPFVGRIVEAYYTNPELTDVAIIHNYKVPKDGAHTDAHGKPNGGKEGTTVYNVTVSESDPRFLALLEEFSYTALGNNNAEDFDETSFTDASLNKGDIVFTAMKGPGSAQYFNGTFEVEF